MIIKILGALDILIALSFWIFGIFDLEFMSGFILILGFFLIAKGIIFLTQLSIASILDLVSAGLIIYGTSVALPNVIVIIVSLFLLQKGIFSMLS